MALWFKVFKINACVGRQFALTLMQDWSKQYQSHKQNMYTQTSNIWGTNFTCAMVIIKPTQKNKFNLSLVSRSKQIACMLKKKCQKVFMSTNQGRLLKTYCSCRVFMDTYIFIEWGTNIIFPLSPALSPMRKQDFPSLFTYIVLVFLFI